MAITIADVRKLRDATSAGIPNAKKALVEVEGNYEKVIELLRVSGLAKVAKHTDRETTNSIVVSRDRILIQFAAETDLMAGNVEFIGLDNQIVDAVAASGAEDLEVVKIAPSGSTTVQEAVQSLTAAIGENLSLVNVINYDGDTHPYLHCRAFDLPLQVGVLVEYTDGGETLVRQVAVHVAAINPVYASRDEVPAEVVENKHRVAEATAYEEDKPEGTVPRIIEERLGGFYKDVVLLDQPVVWEDKKTVDNVPKTAEVKIKCFAHLAVSV